MHLNRRAGGMGICGGEGGWHGRELRTRPGGLAGAENRRLQEMRGAGEGGREAGGRIRSG